MNHISLEASMIVCQVTELSFPCNPSRERIAHCDPSGATGSCCAALHFLFSENTGSTFGVRGNKEHWDRLKGRNFEHSAWREIATTLGKNLFIRYLSQKPGRDVYAQTLILASVEGHVIPS